MSLKFVAQRTAPHRRAPRSDPTTTAHPVFTTIRFSIPKVKSQDKYLTPLRQWKQNGQARTVLSKICVASDVAPKAAASVADDISMPSQGDAAYSAPNP